MMSHKQGVKEAIHDTATEPPRIAVSFSVDLCLRNQTWRYSEKLFKQALHLGLLEETDTYMGCISTQGMHIISMEHPKTSL